MKSKKHNKKAAFPKKRTTLPKLFQNKNGYPILLYTLLFLWLESSCAALFFNTQDTFDILETNHFTFFYIRNSKSEKDLHSIAKYCENGVIWFSRFTGLPIHMKIDVYLIDKDKSVFNTSIASLINSSLESHSINGTVTYFYIENNYLEASSVILHETTHVIQDLLLQLDNTAFSEGFASYIQMRYYHHCTNASQPDRQIFSYLKNFVLTGLAKGDGLPHELFSLSLPEFNRIGSSQFGRDPGYRYEICESFLTYLIMEYDLEKVIQWQKGTNRENFSKHFEICFNTKFVEEEAKWIKKLNETQ